MARVSCLSRFGLTLLPRFFRLLGLRAAANGDLGALLDPRTVLRNEFCWHRQLARTQIPVRRQRRVLPLRQVQLERVDGDVGDGLERAARDPGFADERRTGQIDPDTIAL